MQGSCATCVSFEAQRDIGSMRFEVFFFNVIFEILELDLEV